MTSKADRVGEELLVAHAFADHAFKALMDSVMAADEARIVETFRELERAMLDHLEEEEEKLLPEYEQANPEDAAGLRRDHVKIRSLLADARVDIARGALERKRLLEIMNVFGVHHAHEETGMYRWARSRRSGG